MKKCSHRLCAEGLPLALAICLGAVGPLRATSAGAQKPASRDNPRPSEARASLQEPTPLPAEPTPERPRPALSPSESVPPDTVADLKQEAIEVAGRLMKEFPGSTDPISLMGSVHNQLGNTAEAMDYWQQCLQRDTGRADIYNAMGMIAFRKGECDRAAALWRKALELEPTLPGLHNRLARALMSQGKTREAMAALHREIEISPSASESCFLLGQQYLQLEQYEKAKSSYEKAARINPRLTNAYYGLATVCSRLGHPDRAGEYRKEFARLKAEDRKQLKDQKVAFSDLVAVRQIVARTCNTAARIYRSRDFLFRAEKHWKRAAELDPKNAACRRGLVLLYESRNRRVEAVRMREQLSEIEPNNALNWMNLGIACGRLRRLDAAERAFKKTIELAPKRAWGYRGLAQTYLSFRQRLSEAKRLAQKAVDLEPVAASYFVLSKACDLSGDRQRALATMERAVELDPANREYRRICELIRQRK